MSRELFRAANGFVGHLRGGLGIATVGACGGFAAICGSSVATAATFSAVAYPEMRRFGYPQSFATGVIAAGGTLGAMLPPSTVLAVYGIITEQDIGKLFMAGIIPGLLAIAMYMLTIALIGVVPAGLPADRPANHLARAVRRPEEYLGAGAAVRLRHRRALRPAVPAALHPDRSRRRRRDRRVPDRRAAPDGSTRRRSCNSLLQATRTAAAVFTILIGALIFGYFLTVTQTPQKVTELLTGLGLGPYGVLALIMVMYLVLGCLMDAMAMIILTVPIIFPVIIHLGFDPIWFGVIVVMTVELGLISSAGGHECLRHQERDPRRIVLDDLQGRAAVRLHRPDPAGDPDRISDPGALVAAAHDGVIPMTPQLATKICLHAHRPHRRGDIGRRDRSRRAPDHSDPGRRGARRRRQRQDLRVRRRLPDHPAQRADRTGGEIRLRDRRRRGGLCREHAASASGRSTCCRS